MAKYHVKIVHSKTPIRLFKSDLLEFFTHIHPAVILVIWVPLIGFFLVRAVLDRTAGAWGIATIPLGFLAGLFLWTLTEYTLHRFVFHFPPRNAWQERLSFLFHGIQGSQAAGDPGHSMCQPGTHGRIVDREAVADSVPGQI